MIQGFLKDIMKVMNNKNLIFIILAMLTTSIGAFGGFYRAPKSFTWLVETYPFVQHLLVFVLIYQGQGDENIAKSVIGTIATYGIIRLLYWLDDKYFPEQNKE
jgi:hypothetical protein